MRCLAPLLLLLAYGIAFAAAALGRSLLVYDDHPGQLYRLWHVLTYGPAPWAWDPGWWTGYPEMQFYPPGFTYVGALLYAACLGTLSVGGVYQALLWLIYLAPGLSAFALLARILGDGWLALPGALVALSLSAGLTGGVEGGVHVGMVASRLGWALLPLLPIALSPFVDNAIHFSVTGVLLVAAIALIHPAHLPAAVTFVCLVALIEAPRRRQRLRSALAGLALAAGCTGFWTLPLVVRHSYMRPLAWGTVSLPAASVGLAVAVSAALLLLQRTSRLGRAVTHWAWLTLGVVIGDRIVVEPLGMRWLPADRVADGAWLALVLAAGVAIGCALRHHLPARGVTRPLAALLVIAFVVTLTPAGTLTVWPRRSLWPSYEETERGLRLRAFWDRLAGAPPGRALFVRSGVPLVHGTAWYRPHTHITSLTPIATGRPIVHGTFTHPAPVAAYVYRGRLDGGAITRLAEQLDGHELFGRPLPDLGGHLDGDVADRLGIAVVVALEDDAPSLAQLTEAGRFQRWSEPPFILYPRTQPVSIPTAITPTRWEFVARGQPGAWVTTRVAYYPLWRAAAEGEARATRSGPAGDLEVRLERPVETLTLAYAAGVAEWIGVTVTAASVLVLSIVALRRRAISGSARPSSDDRGSPARTDRSTA